MKTGSELVGVSVNKAIGTALGVPMVGEGYRSYPGSTCLGLVNAEDFRDSNQNCLLL